MLPLTAPQPCCLTRRPQAGSKCPLVATKRRRTATASGIRLAHLQHLLGCQRPHHGGHGAQVSRAHGGESAHDVLIQGTLLLFQASRQLQHPLSIPLQAEGRGQSPAGWWGSAGPAGAGQGLTGALGRGRRFCFPRKA